MKSQLLVKRYAVGLAAALKSEEEYRTVSRELAEFAALLESHRPLNRAILRPFLSAAKKEKIIRDILLEERASDKTGRFLLLLLRHGRLEILPSIVRDLPELWRMKNGIVTFEVRSAVPVRDVQKQRLEAELTKLENRPVACRYALDPAVVGGLLIIKGNLVYDVSLKGQLERLKENIRER
jgi:ATP synthase F1 delta subunit